MMQDYQAINIHETDRKTTPETEHREQRSARDRHLDIKKHIEAKAQTKAEHDEQRIETEWESEEYQGDTETPAVPECVLYADDATINITSGKQVDINERCKNYDRMAWLRKLNIQWEKRCY